jgi:hypothetical protein
VAFGPRLRLDDTPRGFLSKTAFGLKATLLLVQSNLGPQAMHVSAHRYSRIQPYFTLRLTNISRLFYELLFLKLIFSVN